MLRDSDIRAETMEYVLSLTGYQGNENVLGFCPPLLTRLSGSQLGNESAGPTGQMCGQLPHRRCRLSSVCR